MFKEKFFIFKSEEMGIGDWAQSPIPNPHYLFMIKYT